MSTLTLYVVKRTGLNLNTPGSMFIRWALPVSRFMWARGSHSMMVHEGRVYHATMKNGVDVDVPLEEAMHGQTLVAQRVFDVPNVPAAIAWAGTQKGKPYDWRGAFGVSLSPDRIWGSDESWFCHEFCAAMLRAGGRNLFVESGHVTDSALLLVEPRNDSKASN